MQTLSDLYLQDVTEDCIYVPEYPISCRELYHDTRFKFNKNKWKNDYPVTVCIECIVFGLVLDFYCITQFLCSAPNIEINMTEL